ncbi:PEP-CTERM sorting domain-containing protein [Piscinibacter terrae]|uniref:PEP-CTERM sorting domain-containing protein n=1 Tax=Piscinibacter terrae TaxID=2496871 RepID=UPI001F310016|nr:PEP-CTERM sorting domain-containing protein [Albitalea terrae]
MQRKLLAVAALALFSGVASAATNVALGSTVTLSGASFGDSGGWCCGSLAAASTVTDGAVLAVGTQWNTGTVFWTGNAPSITMELAGASFVTHLDLQADNNDDYGVSYRDVGGTWHSLTTISPHRSWGLDNGSVDFAGVTATAFTISAVGGDGFYSVSEFAAIGTPVPEPETYALMLAGLGVVGFMARRRKLG